MSDEFDDLINGALGEFYATEAQVKGPEGDAAMARLGFQKRRRTRGASLSVLAVLVFVLPVAAYAAKPFGNNGPPAASPAPSGTPTATGNPTPATSVTPSSASTVEGQLDAEDVVGLRISTQSTCAEVMPKPPTPTTGVLYLQQLVRLNLDSDPALETAALLYCKLPDRLRWRVVALERGSAGAAVLLGDVIAPQSAPDGTVVAIGSSGGGDLDAQVHQLGGDLVQHRLYGWRKGSFQQVGGPAAFPVGAADRPVTLVVTSRTLVFGEQTADGMRPGLVTVTVKNVGQQRSADFWVELAGAAIGDPGYPMITPLSWAASSQGGPHHAGLAPGESVTATVTYRVPATSVPSLYLSAHLYYATDDFGTDQGEFAITR